MKSCMPASMAACISRQIQESQIWRYFADCSLQEFDVLRQISNLRAQLHRIKLECLYSVNAYLPL